MSSAHYIYPDWNAPVNVKAAVTTRMGGISPEPYESFNMGDHVGDEEVNVNANRQQLVNDLGLSSSPFWLTQVHGVVVADIDDKKASPEADASLTRQKGRISLVMTADCLPVLFCDQSGSVVASAHAGWRGLHAGVLEKTIKSMQVAPANIMAWMGPAIGPEAFEVGEEVRQTFCDDMPLAEQAFKPSVNQNKWMADIYLLATLRLQRAGITGISGGGFCTYTDSERFFSYRRDKTTGRMASLIWME
jgi:YfiH family protein